MGYALGVCGLSLQDFCLLTPIEFEAVAQAWRDRDEWLRREAWERARTSATICVSPWSKHSLQPRQVLPLPWDSQSHEKAHTPPPTRDEAKAILVRLMKNKKKMNCGNGNDL